MNAKKPNKARKAPDRIPYYLNDRDYRRVVGIVIDVAEANRGTQYGRELGNLLEDLGRQRFRQIEKRNGAVNRITIARQYAKKARKQARRK